MSCHKPCGGAKPTGMAPPGAKSYRQDVTRVVIIGGGIGGATAGCALAQAGLDVRVYEAAPELN
jgi:NADPH-dependent 2,4-dienoyl-CoA reductase/sulfur reductase-like enzyme